MRHTIRMSIFRERKMATCLVRTRNTAFSQSIRFAVAFFARHGSQATLKKGPKYRLPQDVEETLEDYLKRTRVKDPVQSVDIGLPPPTINKRDLIRSRREVNWQKRQNRALEQSSRLRTLKIDYDQLRKDWHETLYPHHLKTIAKHYGIFKDLFGPYAEFIPHVPLSVEYDFDSEFVTPVHYGNFVHPSEATTPPHVHYNAEEGTWWSLAMTNPDGHLQDNESEYLQWLVVNIPEDKVNSGEVLCDYLQPFPARGTGYQRYVFLLYKQDAKFDFSKEKRSSSCLKERTFKTYEFYQTYQDVITPAGLCFFQATWDDSVSDVFHKLLGMREPIFKFDWPKIELPRKKKYPFKQYFNLYLDHYRDPKDIAKEILIKRMARISPFKPDPPRRRFPNIVNWDRYYPSWKQVQIYKERWGLGRYKHIYENKLDP